MRTTRILSLFVLVQLGLLMSCDKDLAFIEFTWPDEPFLWFNGKEYTIRWDHNIEGMVNILLFQEDQKIADIELNLESYRNPTII